MEAEFEEGKWKKTAPFSPIFGELKAPNSLHFSHKKTFQKSHHVLCDICATCSKFCATTPRSHQEWYYLDQLVGLDHQLAYHSTSLAARRAQCLQSKLIALVPLPISLFPSITILSRTVLTTTLQTLANIYVFGTISIIPTLGSYYGRMPTIPNESPYFTVKIHHGGIMLTKPNNLVYEHGDVDYMDYVHSSNLNRELLDKLVEGIGPNLPMGFLYRKQKFSLLEG
ncbi:Uncharacterized protein Fot_42254 [Forsythia ovata]|uniref:Uncharacterized protein n=1 Tax=Forsythia ovata TaxID=205694 RepID=A0ABD1RM48_9LAMI